MSDSDKKLEFPFRSRPEFFDEACSTLCELSGSLVIRVDDQGAPVKWGAPPFPRAAVVPRNYNSRNLGTIAFYQNDFDCLERGTFLNDNIIDFFMRWSVTPCLFSVFLSSFSCRFLSSVQIFPYLLPISFCA